MKRTRCQKGPAKRCAPLRSYGIVRLRTDFTILKCYQAQRKIGGQKETHCVPLRSIPDQQLGRTQPNRVTSDHLLCCWKLLTTLLMTLQPPRACIHGLRYVIFTPIVQIVDFHKSLGLCVTVNKSNLFSIFYNWMMATDFKNVGKGKKGCKMCKILHSQESFWSNISQQKSFHCLWYIISGNDSCLITELVT